jgi:hypothetical protein
VTVSGTALGITPTAKFVQVHREVSGHAELWGGAYGPQTLLDKGGSCNHEDRCSFLLSAFVSSGQRFYGVCSAVGGSLLGPMDVSGDMAAENCEIEVTVLPCHGGLLPRRAHISRVCQRPRRPPRHCPGDTCHEYSNPVLAPFRPPAGTNPPTTEPITCQSDPSACAQLTVAVDGVPTPDPLSEAPLSTGYGDVSASPPDAVLRCPYGSDYRYCVGTLFLPKGTKVTLNAAPDSTNASYFASWSGDGSSTCPGSSTSCTVTIGDVSHVTALFGAAIYRLTIDNSTNPSAGQVVPSGFSGTGPTYDRIACGLGVNDCTAYYPAVDGVTWPNFTGPAPLSLAQNGVIEYDNEQWYIQFDSGCDAVRVVVDGSNRYTVCYYSMTSDRTIKVSWTTTPP